MATRSRLEQAQFNAAQKDTCRRLWHRAAHGVQGPITTIPRVPDAYLTCRGVQKDDILTKGDVCVETNRYEAQLALDGRNSHHVALIRRGGATPSLSYGCKSLLQAD